MEEILGRLHSYGTLQVDSLESIRNKYVVTLLHAAIHIIMDEKNKKLSICPQYSIVKKKAKVRLIILLRKLMNLFALQKTSSIKWL